MFHPFVAALVSTALLAVTAFAKDDLKAENNLLRPPGAPDSDAAGHVRVEIDLSKNRHRLSIEADHIDSSLAFEAWIADATGSLQNTGAMPVNGLTEVEIEFDSQEGLPIPFGVTDVKALSGRAVEVRVAGVVYLKGTVPSVSGGGGGGGGGDDSGGGGGGSAQKVKSFLVRPSGSIDPDVKGYVELRTKGSADQKFKVEVEHVDVAVALTVWVESALNSQTYALAGTLTVNGIEEVQLEIETENGDALPGGVDDVSDLEGLRIEVRDATDAVYLYGILPAISGTSTANGKATAKFSGSGGELKVRVEAKKGNQRLDIEVRKLVGTANVDIVLMDLVTMQFVEIATIALNSNGNGKFSVETKSGESLPLSMTTVAGLGGLAVEVRDAVSQAVLITGIVPNM